MKTILITGANGFIGQNITDFLLHTTRDNLILVDNYFGDDRITNNPRVQLIEHNLEKTFDRELIFDVDVVIHLAAIVGETACLRDIYRAVNVNTYGTLNTIRQVNIQHLKKFIFFSTSNVYLPDNKPINEDGNINTGSIYSTTKLASESIIRNYFHDLPVFYYFCRVSNVYGPDHQAPTMINYIIKQFVSKSEIELFGPHDKRDFVYIDDIVEGINLLINKPVESGKYNFGGDEPLSKIDITKICSEILGESVNIKMKDKPERSLYLDSSKIRKTGWKPKVNMKIGLKNCINKYKKGKSYDKKK